MLSGKIRIMKAIFVSFSSDKKQTLFQILCQVFQPVPLKMDDTLQRWTRVTAESNKLGGNKKANVICSQERD